MSVATVTIAATIESSTPLADNFLAKLQGTVGVGNVVEDQARMVVEFNVTNDSMAGAKAVIGEIARKLPGVPIKWSAVEST